MFLREPAPSQAALDRVFAEEDSLADVWETPAQAGTILSATMTAPVNRLPEKPLPQPMPTPKVSAGWLGRGLRVLSAMCLLLAGWCFWPAAQKPPAEVAQAATVTTEKRLLTRPIQDMRPGMRVLAENPELMEADVEPLLIEPAQWRLVSLKMAKPDSQGLSVELLRPLDWLEENKAQVGGTVELDLEELGASGPAMVTAIDPCPAIEKGQGRLVTGRFAHTAANVIDVHVDGQDEPIGTTDNHPFWSEDRQAFVPAGELKIGERLRTVTGSQIRVKALSPRGPPEAVYNLEVEGEHVYYVTANGILVHKNYGNSNIVYRVLRPDENVRRGLRARNPRANYSVEGHVLNGSRPNFGGSQYISTTRSLDVARRLAAQNPGARIAVINLQNLGNARIIDLTNQAIRNQFLRGNTARNFAKSWLEVLIEGFVPPRAVSILR